MKVAISQPKVIYGGRVKVLLGITDALNELGIKPLWLTAEMPGTNAEIAKRYSSRGEYDTQFLDFRFPYQNECGRIKFNRKAAKWCQDNGIDWLINSSNTVLGFNGFSNVISYVHFPREARVLSPLRSIHVPDSRVTIRQRDYYRKLFFRLVFSLGRIQKDHLVLTNSKFTQAAWDRSYGNARLVCKPEVMYPFADDPNLPLPGADGRGCVAVSVGRFCQDKGQLRQVEAALRAPEVRFWLIGHAGENNAYFKRVEAYVRDRKVSNVELLTDLSASDLSNRLRQARYFIHTNMNEPFGITAVEAVFAGCMPVVHNSGGQREVVPIPELRFDTSAQIPEILRFLERERRLRSEWLERLQELAMENFTHSKFVQRFKEYFGRVSSIRVRDVN